MKTNNVDFGKSFKFICRSDAGETVYTCHKANKDEICKVTWLKFYTEDKGSTTFTVPNIKKSIEEGHWIVLPSDTKEILGDIGPELNFSLNKNDRITEDYTRECIDKLNDWIGCMSYNDSYFGEPAGMLKSTIRQLDKAYKEGKSHNTEKNPEDNLLDQIKHFTATSKHSVNVYEGVYEVFRSGEDMAYKCKDDEQLRSVMQALSVLDGVNRD